MANEEFENFLTRIRAGDAEAAADLVRRYESVIRREIRFRLTDPSVRRQEDDEDVCQAVLASFFVRAALGEYELTDPAQLRGLLLQMARNKLARAHSGGVGNKQDKVHRKEEQGEERRGGH